MYDVNISVTTLFPRIDTVYFSTTAAQGLVQGCTCSFIPSYRALWGMGRGSVYGIWVWDLSMGSGYGLQSIHLVLADQAISVIFTDRNPSGYSQKWLCGVYGSDFPSLLICKRKKNSVFI